MDRLNKFHSLSAHAYLSKLYFKLTQAELQICYAFIAANESADINIFEHNLNRMFLDKEKPKHWAMIQELLSASK